MLPILANTIWGPLFVYRYDTASALLSFLIAFIAECWVFWIYIRPRLALWGAVRDLALANLASYIAGHLLLPFVIGFVHKNSLPETALAFLAAYLVTVPIEYGVLRPLLPNDLRLLIRAVTMSNFVSYSILFVGYFLWFFNWNFLMRVWTGRG